MLILAMIVLTSIMAFNQPVYAQTKTQSEKSEIISQSLTKIVNEGNAPGMIAAIISSEGVIAIGAAGVRKAGTDITITTGDLVHLGSCTKAMTAAMLATLVAEGKMSWDMKLIEAIPELKQKIHKDYHKITLWQLLTHRAGIPKNPTDWNAYTEKEIRARRLAILEDSFKNEAYYEYGEHNYSNFGYMVAACMAENITGLSWETLMRQRVFEPLGMTTAGFGDPDIQNTIAQPWGHHKYGSEWNPSKDYYAEVLGPAGEIHCSIADWAKFLSLQLTSENAILDSTYLNKLIEPVGYYAGGWGVAEHPWAKGIVLSHTGSNEIWYASVMVAPKLNRAFVVVVNGRDFGTTEGICNEILGKMIRMEL